MTHKWPRLAAPWGWIASANEFVRNWLGGKLPPWLPAQSLILAAFCCFVAGILLSLCCLPAGFDYGACVISRLCSSVHNPDGFQYMALGMSGMAVLLLPIPAFLSCRYRGCERLCAWGRSTMLLGLAATIAVGFERACCPTHWSRYEMIHLTLAGTAFLCLWLGMAMFAGAAGPPGTPRVRWQWLWRPPWYLAVCVLPIGVVFGMYLPLSVMPSVRHELSLMMPRRLIFLRTVTFWQWYLVLGLTLGMAKSVCRGCRLERLNSELSAQGWRLDPAQAASPHLYASGDVLGMDSPAAQPGEAAAVAPQSASEAA